MNMNREGIAKLLGVTTQSITDWRASEGLPFTRAGKQIRYPAAECVAWLIDRRLAAAQGSEHAAAMAAAKLKKEQETAIKLELANQSMRGELVPVALAAERYAIFCSTVRAGCLSIPAALGRACPELSASGTDVVRRVIARTLNSVADGTFQPEAEPEPTQNIQRIVNESNT